MIMNKDLESLAAHSHLTAGFCGERDTKQLTKDTNGGRGSGWCITNSQMDSRIDD